MNCSATARRGSAGGQPPMRARARDESGEMRSDTSTVEDPKARHTGNARSRAEPAPKALRTPASAAPRRDGECLKRDGRALTSVPDREGSAGREPVRRCPNPMRRNDDDLVEAMTKRNGARPKQPKRRGAVERTRAATSGRRGTSRSGCARCGRTSITRARSSSPESADTSSDAGESLLRAVVPRARARARARARSRARERAGSCAAGLEWVDEVSGGRRRRVSARPAPAAVSSAVRRSRCGRRSAPGRKVPTAALRSGARFAISTGPTRPATRCRRVASGAPEWSLRYRVLVSSAAGLLS